MFLSSNGFEPLSPAETAESCYLWTCTGVAWEGNWGALVYCRQQRFNGAFFFFFLPEQTNKKNNDEKCVWEIQTLYCSTRSIALQYSAQIIGWKIISGKYSSQHLTRGLFPNSKEIFVKQSLRTTNIWALIVSV